MKEYRLARFESVPKDKQEKITLPNTLTEEETKIESANQDFIVYFLDRMSIVHIKTHFDIFLGNYKLLMLFFLAEIFG